MLALEVAVSAEVQHEMADGIGGVTAVSQDVVESFEARDGLILAEGAEEIRELMFGDVELAHGFGEGNENGMARIAVVTGVKLELPLIEEGEGSGSVADFVAEIVGDAAIRVEVEEMLAEAAGEKPAGDGEIFVVGAGEASAVFLAFFE
jgi:hypothetical protein